MRYGLISDVHSNSHALEAVLADLDKQAPVDKLLCMGDIVGYNAKPNEVVEMLRHPARNVIAVSGNHDLAAVGGIGTDLFNPAAAAGVAHSRRVLTPENLAWLKDLPLTRRVDDAFMCHGSPRDPIWEYVFQQEASAATLLQLAVLAGSSVVLLGHTHYPMAVSVANPDAPGGKTLFLNPGSVGQPRDGNPLASYIVFDSEARQPAPYVALHRVPYDVEGACAAIREARLPDSLWKRLKVGG